MVLLPQEAIIRPTRGWTFAMTPTRTSIGTLHEVGAEPNPIRCGPLRPRKTVRKQERDKSRFLPTGKRAQVENSKPADIRSKI
jgi:hypothetical protein